MQVTSLSFIGDIYPGGDIAKKVVLDPDYAPLSSITQRFTDNTVIVANLESTIARTDTPVPKYATLLADPDIIQRFKEITVAVLGNNHVGDYGLQAMIDTREHLENAGIRTVGLGVNLQEALKPAIITRNDLRIGIVSLSCISTNGQNYAATGRPGVAPLSTKLLRHTITSSRNECDVLIPYLHWGEERSHAPVIDQIRLARLAIDWGADAVIGSHAHVIQAYEQYKGKWIFYGLGNFLFPDVSANQLNPDGTRESVNLNQAEENRQSLVVNLRVSKERVQLNKVLPVMYYSDELTPYPITMDRLTFDLDDLNKKLRRFSRRAPKNICHDREPVYRTSFFNNNLVHRYESPSFLHAHTGIMDRILRTMDTIRSFLLRNRKFRRNPCS
ncbi:MAG TPA: CapA family protein [Deltaproteobacteria bacterium]|nr:CapA family protein [Deltaproteobacteria bacterium]